MQKQFAVIGIGRFGSSVARTLVKMGYEVLAIDRNPNLVQDFAREFTHVVEADATDPDNLKALGIRNFDVVVVAIGDDIQASIMVTLLLKEMGVKHVVVKAVNDLHGKVLEKIGADRVVYPERDMGIRVAHQLVSRQVLDQIQLSSEYRIIEVVAPARFAGKTLGALNLRARWGVAVLAIRREENIVVGPGAEDEIKAGDILVVLGRDEELARLEEEPEEKKR